MRPILRRLGLFALLLALLSLGGYRIAIASLSWRETADSSTRQVLITSDGRQIPLVQPTAAQPTQARPAPSSAPAAGPDEVQPTPQPPSPPILPPERLRIPTLAIDWPVTLATVDHLPAFRGVGWLIGSAFPGARGNLVLFGHRGGDYGTLMRLPELRVGDTFSVFTAELEYRYQVRTIFETTPDDVAVLAPTDTATATLITCTGPWDAVAQSNQLRLIVVADLSDTVPLDPPEHR